MFVFNLNDAVNEKEWEMDGMVVNKNASIKMFNSKIKYK